MRRTLTLTLLALAAAPATAGAHHPVQPGDTLIGIAARHGVSPADLAAANGLSPDALVVAGTELALPGQAPTATVRAAGQAPPPPAGAYTVQPGDTFSSLAARAGVRAEQVAGVNGLDVNAPLPAGASIRLPTASAPAQQPQAQPTQATAPQAAPRASSGRVSSGDIHAVAGQHGVDGALAAAIAWQESGFNNAMVSSANARGVMQVMPGTWDYVQRNLAQRRLDPSSATDNVHAGTLYLRSLLRASGGDPVTAAAGYYQGPASVARIGMLPETQRYVANVMALRQRFAR
jgi:N-acetylmuramoyl-L-alanine amidase